MQILNFIFENVAGFFTLAFLARFAMQWARAPFRNPIGQFVVTVTDWAVLPARRVIPTAWGLDLPSLLLAWLTQAIYLGVIYAMSGFFSGGTSSFAIVALIALVAVIETASMACTLVIGIVIISALLSWINPHAPVAPVINAISGPLLRPFQRIIPLVGGIDLSPIALFFAVKLIQIMLTSARAGLFNSLLPMH